MEKIGEYGYKADKGKRFVLTQKGKEEWASFKNKTVGEPVDVSDPYYASISMIEGGAVTETDDPDWVVMPGYRAVYDLKGDGKYIFDTGNPIVYPYREMAEAAAAEFNSRDWTEQTAYVIEATYEGRKPKPCREFNGKKVYNKDTWTYAFPIGSLVEQEVVDYAINAVPPACTRSDCMQCGEPADNRKDDKDVIRNTFETFKRVTEDIYEYCGDCFRGENIQRGTAIPTL